MKILILGPSGAGKTYLAKEFKKMGLNAHDSDQIEGLRGWYDWENKKVPFPIDADKEFFDNHQFLWNREFLENFLANNPDIYLFGNSGNIPEVINLFDKVYFLKVPEDIILERLDHQSRKNPIGKTDYQKKVVLEWTRENEKEVVELGAKLIDGTLTPKEILSLI